MVTINPMPERHRGTQFIFRIDENLDKALADAAETVELPFGTFVQQYLRAAVGMDSLASLRPFSTGRDAGGEIVKNIFVTDEEKSAIDEHAEEAEVSRAVWVRCALRAAVKRHLG